MRIEVIRESSAKGTHRYVWLFWVHTRRGNIEIVLDEYHVETRPSARHKWRRDQSRSYLRLGRRGIDGFDMRVEDVPRPPEVAAEVRQRLAMRFKVVTDTNHPAVQQHFGDNQ
jgi:hypothetical protein